MSNKAHFGDRLQAALQQTGTPLCMGIDPHLRLLPAFFGAETPRIGCADTVAAMRKFAFAAVDVAAGSVPAIKPQAALFEQHGPAGMQLLADLARYAQSRELLVIMDAKRGDIGSTSAAYAAAFLGDEAPFPSDALTVNAYMGMDTLRPFIDQAMATKSGLFVLVRTSNPGSSDLQEQQVNGVPLYQILADKLAPLTEEMATDSWSSLGIVAGATWPEEARQLRQQLPLAPVLVPGFGAQGAGASDALSALEKRDGYWQGGLVNASRGLTFCPAALAATDIEGWQTATANQITEMSAALNAV